MNRDTARITVKDVELEVEFTWSRIIRATREQPEDGGIEEIESVNCEGCELEKDFEKCSLLNNNKCKFGYIYVKTT